MKKRLISLLLAALLLLALGGTALASVNEGNFYTVAEDSYDASYDLQQIPSYLAEMSKAKGFEPLIGDDDAPWLQIFDFCAGPGATEWFIIEYECPALPPMEAVEKCLINTKRLLGQSC